MSKPSVPKASPEAQEALAQLAAVIADPEQRRSFAVDARATLEKAGVPLRHLPDAMVDRLGGLGLDELTIIGEHCEDLMAHGFWVELPNGGRSCFF